MKSNLIAKKKTDGTFGVFEKYRKTTYKPKSIWDDNSFLTETGTVELRELGLDKVFDFPKPVSLGKQILNLSIQDDDIILDFFAGSGTTAQAVLELNKKMAATANLFWCKCLNLAMKTAKLIKLVSRP